MSRRNNRTVLATAMAICLLAAAGVKAEVRLPRIFTYVSNVEAQIGENLRYISRLCAPGQEGYGVAAIRDGRHDGDLHKICPGVGNDLLNLFCRLRRNVGGAVSVC